MRECLFPFSRTDDAIARISRGLRRISVWECRGRVPLAVQITAQLLHLKISDNASTWKGTQDFDSHAGGVDGKVPVTRLAYAMVVTRLVNGVVEPEQRAHGYAASVSDIASRCGLPRWFVDLRHDATHTSLPTLVTLRLAADTALEWLQSRYWDSQAAHLDAEPDRLRILVNEVAALNHKVYLAASQSTKTKKSKKNSQKKIGTGSCIEKKISSCCT